MLGYLIRKVVKYAGSYAVEARKGLNEAGLKDADIALMAKSVGIKEEVTNHVLGALDEQVSEEAHKPKSEWKNNVILIASIVGASVAAFDFYDRKTAEPVAITGHRAAILNYAVMRDALLVNGSPKDQIMFDALSDTIAKTEAQLALLIERCKKQPDECK